MFSKRFEVNPGFDFLVVKIDASLPTGVSREDGGSDWYEFLTSMVLHSLVIDSEDNVSPVILIPDDAQNYQAISREAGAIFPVASPPRPGSSRVLELVYSVSESAGGFKLHFEDKLGLPEISLGDVP